MTSSVCHHGVYFMMALVLILVQKGDLTSDPDAPKQIVLGEPLTFLCNPPNIDQDDSIVEWIKDGEEDNILVSDEQYIVDNDKRTLTIKTAEDDDAGTYECRTTSAQPLRKQFSAFFFALSNLPETTCVEEGGTINLTCLADGKPIPTVQWLKVFALSNLPDTTCVEEGGTINLTCLADGKPIPTVQWLKDGKKLNDSKYSYKSNEHYISNAVLSFANVQGTIDNGKYTCQVFSDMGTENTTTNLKVQESCESPSGLGVGEIVGIVIGVVVVVGLIVGAVFLILKKRHDI